jgi:hypothetical protein
LVLPVVIGNIFPNFFHSKSPLSEFGEGGGSKAPPCITLLLFEAFRLLKSQNAPTVDVEFGDAE